MTEKGGRRRWGRSLLMARHDDDYLMVYNPSWVITKAILVEQQWYDLTHSVVYWPSTQPNIPFQRRGSCIFHWRRRAWLTIWDTVKSHGTVRLMHQKRVTCELHDSYSLRWQSNMPFQWQRKWHIPMASYGEILSGRLNYYITRWRQKVSSLVWRPVWKPDPLVTRCGRGSLHPAEWALRPPVEQPWRAGKRRWP